MTKQKTTNKQQTGKAGKTAKSAKKQPKTNRSAAVAHVITEDEQREAAMKPVNQWRSYIRRLLNEDSTYKRKYTYQVTLAAQSLHLLQDCYFEIQKQQGDKFTVTEISREGNPRKAENPLVTMYIKLNAMCMKNLSALGMNMTNLVEPLEKAGAEDPLKALMEMMQK